MNEDLFQKNSIASRSKIKREFVKLVEYKCSECYNVGEHNGKKLVLELDHINGVNSDNRFENLRLLCPNCHSQQKTSNRRNTNPKFSGRFKINEKEVLEMAKDSGSIRQILLKLNCLDSGVNYQRIKQVLDINGVTLLKTIKVSTNKERKERFNCRKVARPSKEDLAQMVWEKPTETIAKEFGVSGAAVFKWCKLYGIPKPPRGYWAKIQYGLVSALPTKESKR